MTDTPYYTINQFNKKHPAFAMGGLRDKIFKSDINGLDEFKAIVRIGKRVLIHEERFFKWIDSLNDKDDKPE